MELKNIFPSLKKSLLATTLFFMIQIWGMYLTHGPEIFNLQWQRVLIMLYGVFFISIPIATISVHVLSGRQALESRWNLLAGLLFMVTAAYIGAMSYNFIIVWQPYTSILYQQTVGQLHINACTLVWGCILFLVNMLLSTTSRDLS